MSTPNKFKPKLYPILKKFHDAEERHNRSDIEYTADDKWQEARIEYLALSVEDKLKFIQLAECMKPLGIYSEIIDKCQIE